MKPSVTVAIPVYNEEKYIKETIRSAMDQTYDNLKIIIADNCSQDKTLEYIQKIVVDNSNITVFKHEKNIGAAGNFEFLLEKSDTDFFCWLGGHDVLDKLFIEKAVEIFMKQPSLSLVYPASTLIEADGTSLNKFSYDDLDTTQLNEVQGPLKVVRNCFYCSAVNGLFKTNILKKYKLKNIIGGDHSILYHASLYGKLFFLPTVTNFYRIVRKETQIDTLERYVSIGLKYQFSDNPYYEMCNELVKSTVTNHKISLLTKVRLLPDLLATLHDRFNYKRFSLIRELYPRILKIKNTIAK